MIFRESSLPGCFVIEPEKFSDSRGWFFRSFCAEEFKSIGFTQSWVQHNHSYTALKGTVRGMHFQKPPAGETKLIRCIAGRVFDVAVDLRANSPTFLAWHAEELSAKSGAMIFIPEGFAHGFQALTDDAELVYCHSKAYQREYEGGLNFEDKRLNINWPLNITEISERDTKLPFIGDNFEGLIVK